MAEKPYSRSAYNRALLRNALLDPFAVLLLAAIVIAGILLGVVLPVLPVALVAYGVAAGRTYFDEDEANKVLERERGKRRHTLERARLDPNTLAPPIRDLVTGARQRESRIREAIQRAQLPFEEVEGEVDAFLEVMEGSANRAQLLYETLAENPPDFVEQRMESEQRAVGPGREYRAELVDALGHQLTVLRRMEKQLARYYDEMERVLVELDTVRGSLVSASASTDTERQRALAADVRGLREEVGSLSEGMSEAYDAPPA
jgi:chromosome segregation ATPase